MTEPLAEPAVEVGDELELSPEQSRALEQEAKILADVYLDPQRIAERLAQWAKDNLPERVSSALWVTAKGERDKGIEIELRTISLWKDRFRVRLGGLVGAASAGLSLTAPLLTTPSVTVRAGAGAVVRFADLSKVDPVLVLTLKF